METGNDETWLLDAEFATKLANLSCDLVHMRLMSTARPKNEECGKLFGLAVDNFCEFILNNTDNCIKEVTAAYLMALDETGEYPK